MEALPISCSAFFDVKAIRPIMRHEEITRLLVLIMLILCNQVQAADDATRSYHGGFFHPNGLDLVGYSVEKKISEGIYRYYTFGIPSGAAIGYNYYSDFRGNGLNATIGVGIGVLFTTSLAYQFHLDKENYFKIGAGYTANVGYEGVFPVLSYEQRF
jgi:hypothetical protein